jgi:hypothetical protein
LMITFGAFDRVVTGMVSVVSTDIQLLPPSVPPLLLVLFLMCKCVDLPLATSQFPLWVTIRRELERCLAA